MDLDNWEIGDENHFKLWGRLLVGVLPTELGEYEISFKKVDPEWVPPSAGSVWRRNGSDESYLFVVVHKDTFKYLFLLNLNKGEVWNTPLKLICNVKFKREHWEAITGSHEFSSADD